MTTSYKIFFTSLLFLITTFLSTRIVFSWGSNPYPYPGGSFDCQFGYTQSPGEIDISIVSGSTQQMIWLSVENNTGQPASWQFLDPNQSWPIDYLFHGNTDAEGYRVNSTWDSVGFQDGGTGPWIRQVIPDGIYRLHYTGTLAVENINVSFQNQNLSWSRACLPIPISAEIKPQLTVIKNVIKDNGGTANVEDFTLKVGDTTVISGETNSFDANTYTVTETGPTGYTTTFGGDCDQNGQITLQVGDLPKTCTITNDDIAPLIPTPIPVTKVFMVPGFGASWNASALLGCNTDPDPSHWSLAPYAETVYQPILDSLPQNDRVVLPFYYDWRAKITSNSSALAESINTRAPGDEKVNIIGHSMGGLVAGDYVANNKYTKTNKFLAIGSPLKGVVQAYPTWAGGDIWQDNFISKIAVTLYLKHCGGISSNDRITLQNKFPSVNNLLPSFGYLIDSKTRFPIDNPNTVNNWSINPTDLLNTNFKTLTGTGFNTLFQIPVKSPSKRDVSQNNWLDGKPTGKIFSTQGDGTVLLSSSRIDDDHNETLNLDHSGLIASKEGACKILEFLNGSPCITQAANFSEPNSALVIVGYPSNFWVSDQNGNTKKDKDGMVAFVNPKSGNYKLNLFPKSKNTLIIVAQFLPNGDVKYKEYKFQGFEPKLKSIKFDLNSPSEDILN